MDFEELILKALQTKFPGVDAKILGRIAKKRAKTANTADQTEDGAKTIVDGITLQQVIESYGDFKATEASSTAISSYEKRHNIKDGKPIEQPAQTAQQGAQQATAQTAQQGGNAGQDEPPTWAKLIIDAQAKINQRFEQIDAEKIGNTRLAAFKEAIKTAPEKVRLRYEKDFERLSFKDDDDFNSYLEEIRPDIEAMAADNASKGGTFGSPLGGGAAGAAASELVKARFAQSTTAASVSPAIAGLPTNTPA
jgi:hypothetical protein